MGTSEQFPGWYGRVDGPDGSGKTTLINKAKEYAAYENLDVEFIREPGTGEFGDLMRELLLHKTEHNFSPQTEYSLFLANRTHLVSQIILPRLRAGKGTISDRGPESSAVMQGGKAGEIMAQIGGWEESLTTDRILEISRLLLPDFYNRPNGLVLLSLDKAVRRERMRAKAELEGVDRFEGRGTEWADAVHDGYIDLETRLPHATVINSEQDPAEVFRQARPILFGPEHA